MMEADYVVYRANPRTPHAMLSKLEGLWVDRSSIPHLKGSNDRQNILGLADTRAVAEPTGRFEVRDSDGAVAEVFEITIVSGKGVL